MYLSLLPLLILFHCTPLSSCLLTPSAQEPSELITIDATSPSGNIDAYHPRRRVKRIAGGYEAPEGFYTSIVSLRWKNSETKKMGHICGGTLFDRRFVLTAAACIGSDLNATFYDVMAGDWDNTKTEGTEQQMKVAKIHVHPKWTEDVKLDYDIAILELETNVTITDFVTVASLPTSKFNHFNGRMCTALGWGQIDDEEGSEMSSVLRAAQVVMYNHTACAIAANDDEYYGVMNNRSLCVGYAQGEIGSCNGDNGGPLLCQNSDGIDYVIGIGNWATCGKKSYMGVYTKVAEYLPWIKKVTAPAQKPTPKPTTKPTEKPTAKPTEKPIETTEKPKDNSKSRKGTPMSNTKALKADSTGRRSGVPSPNRALSPSTSTAHRRVKRIVGGYTAPEGFYTSIVGIRKLNNETKRMSHQCGGTLITTRFVLSAAHCFKKTDILHPELYDIMAGDTDYTITEGTEQQVKVAKIHFYPKYQANHKTETHDIILLELETSVTLNEFVTTASLPPSEFNLFNGRLCSIQGWGAEGEGEGSTSILRAGQVVVYDRISCSRLAGDKEILSRFNFCAGYEQGGIDTCQGDSGGPLTCQDNDGSTYLTGITSWGIGCGRKNNLGVYTKVSKYLEWIEEVVSGNS